MKKLLTLCFMILSLTVYATDIQVDFVTLNKKEGEVRFIISWKNSWHNDKNHDAAWVFVKFKNPDGSYTHGILNEKEHQAFVSDNGPKGRVIVSEDRVGVFVEPSQSFRGDVSWQVRLKIEPSLLKKLPKNTTPQVYALEMVYIPAGGFTLGDPDPKALDYASFFRSDNEGNPNGLYEIRSEDQVIEVGPEKGKLYHKSGEYPQYTGDRSGTVPSTFPKGAQPFYMMKYEVQQGFYTRFLNTQSPDIAMRLSPHTVKDYYATRGSIRLDQETYVADHPERPCNYITWDDGAAMADWSGLRPMTELEFTKAARGPEKPIKHGFPWGTDNKEGLERFVDLDDELKLTEGFNEADITDENRHRYGASYYWVMDLAGSLWEKCVTIGHPIGRSFRGSHGDGVLSETGSATNKDWPSGIHEEGGYGYRGGGYYQHGKEPGPFNPHSPIAYRPYGSWSGGKKSIAYSQRYVRTAPKQ